MIARNEERSGRGNGLCGWINKKSYEGRCREKKSVSQRKTEKWFNGLRWRYRQRDNERETNKVMDMIRACVAEMQRVLMGSLDSRLRPTD